MKKQLRGYENQTKVVLVSKVEGMRLCVDCGEVHHEDDMKEFDGEYVCESCLVDNDDYFFCRECEEYFKVSCEDYRYDGYNDNYVCETCYYNNNMVTCDDCDEIISDYNCNMVNKETSREKWVCDGCLDNYYKCDECGDYYEDNYIALSSDNMRICDCCEDNYTTCDGCGEVIHREDSYSEDDGYEVYCNSCFEEIEEASNGDTRGLKNYSFKPRPKFNNSDEEEKEWVLYLGVENEVDNGDDRREAIGLVNDKLGHIYCKSDGSLGSNGFEMTSFPCDLDYHSNLKKEYENVFRGLVSNYGYRSHDTRTCGLHVHCNRTFFGEDEDLQDLQIAKIILLIDNLWDKGLVNFTRRKEEELNRWAKKFNEVTQEEIEQEEEEIKIVRKCTRGRDRYKAINVQNEHTFEFRIFKGTLKIDTYMATLQFVSNICNMIENVKLRDINTITMKDIISFEEYEELNTYAQKRGLL